MPKFAVFNEEDKLITTIVASSKESAEKLMSKKCVEIVDELEFSRIYAFTPEDSMEQVD